MPINFDRAKEVFDFFSANGVEKSISNFNVSSETLYRYLRKYKEMNPENQKQEVLKDFSTKILILDIETKPLSSWTWGVWKQNISHEQINSDWMILTWAAKWLGYPEIYSGKITPEEVFMEDDSRIIKDVWNFVDAANIIVCHNGDGFDLVRLNTRFLISGLQPPSPYQSIDTLKIAKKRFAFSLNKLDYIGQILGLGGKLDTGGMKLWLNVLKGDQESINLMERYNKRDVTLLEEVYLRLRPWITSHPNMSLHIEDNETRCPVCTGTNLTWLDKYYTTQVGKYSVFRCNDCGAVGRSRTTALTKEKLKHLVISTAR